MLLSEQFKDELQKEFKFVATRSSGPGGQNVNKVSSKIELRFTIESSKLFSTEQKLLLLKRLAGKLTNESELIITSQEERSQLQNKQITLEKIFSLLTWALNPPKKRLHTRPTRSSVERRIEFKKQRSSIKQNRRKTDF